jgi:hypothetical protein
MNLKLKLEFLISNYKGVSVCKVVGIAPFAYKDIRNITKMNKLNENIM